MKINYPILVIDPDNCYICDGYNEFDKYKYLGLGVYHQYFRIWINNKYEDIIIDNFNINNEILEEIEENFDNF